MTTNKILKFIIGSIVLCLSCQTAAQAPPQKAPPQQQDSLRQVREKKTPPENDDSKKFADNYVIEYDFSTGLYNKNTVKPKVHYPVVYRIKNINRFAYKIEVKAKDSVLAYSFSLDGLSKQIFAPSKNEKEAVTSSMNDLPRPIAGMNSNDIKDGADKTLAQKKSLAELMNSTVQILELNKQIATDSEKLNSISKKIDNDSTLFKLLSKLDAKDPRKEEISKVKKSIEMEIGVLEKVADTNSNKKEEIADRTDILKILDDQENLIIARKTLDSVLKKSKADKIDLEATQAALGTFIKDNEKLGELFLQYRQTFREVEKINRCYERLYELISYHQLTYDMAQDKVKEFKEEQKDKFADYQNQIAVLKSRYYEMQVQYGILKRNFTLHEKLSESGQAKLYGQADDYMNRAKNMFEKINLVEVQRKLNVIPLIIESLSNKDTFELKSQPIQPIGDVVSFDIDIQAKNKTGDKILNERKFRHQEFTYGGTRIDFGLGLAASSFGNTPVYELQVKNIDSLSEITIQKKSDKVIVPSVIGLVTMSHRSSRYTSFGGSAGLGIDVVNGKIQLSNFFVGPSITFGRYERLTFTAGTSLRNVQQLKSGFEVNTKVISDDIENYLTSKYKIGFFASLTFVLTKGVKENLSKIPAYR